MQDEDKDNDFEAIIATTEALVQLCRERRIAYTNGETAVLNTLKGMELAVSMTGFIKARKIIPNKFEVKDILIGLPSNGLHSNGFTLARQVLGEGPRPEFVMPTMIYLDALSKIVQRYRVNGMMNITGGAFTKLKDLLPSYGYAGIHKGHGAGAGPTTSAMMLDAKRLLTEMPQQGD